MKTLLIILFLFFFSFLFVNCDTETTNPINIVYDTLYDTVEVATIDTVLMTVWDSMYIVNTSGDTSKYEIVSEIDYNSNMIDYYILGGFDTSQSYIMGGYYLFDQNFNIISNVMDFYYWQQPKEPKIITSYTYESNNIIEFKQINFDSGDTTAILIFDSLRYPIREKNYTYSGSTNQLDSVTKDVYYRYIFNSDNRPTSQIIYDSNNVATDTLHFSYSNNLPSGYNFNENYIKCEPAIQSNYTGSAVAFQVIKYYSNGIIAEDHQFDSTNTIMETILYSKEGFLSGGILYGSEGEHFYTQYKTYKNISCIIHD